MHIFVDFSNMFERLSIALMLVCVIVAEASFYLETDDEANFGTPFSPRDFEEAANYDFTAIPVTTQSKTADHKIEDFFDDASIPSKVVKPKVNLWNDGIVPYHISKDFNATQRRVIVAAMYAIQNNSCIQFLSCNDTSAHFVYIKVSDFDACKSEIGSVRPYQKLYLGPGCFFSGVGIILHEMLHLIGIEHEHSRPDRDKNIKFTKNNTIIELTKIDKKNFEIREWGHLQDACEDYDVGSIMHYGSWHNNVSLFTHEGNPKEFFVGQRIFPSETDIRKVNRMYKCGFTNLVVRRQILKIENDINRFVPDLMKRCTNCIGEKQSSCIKLINQIFYC